MRFRQTIRRAWLLTAYYTAITIFGIGTLTYNLLTALLSLLGPLAPSSAALRKSNTILVRLFSGSSARSDCPESGLIPVRVRPPPNPL